MATFMELSKETEKALLKCAELAGKLGYNTAEENIREQLAAFKERELTVVVAGEARRGKSSLLNALLNEKEAIFPVDVNVCTNVVTILRYGETERFEVCIEDKSEQGYRVETIQRNQIDNYVSEKGNPNNFRNVKLLKAYVPNELLKEGVVFVDTPGVGSLNIEHAEATYGFLPNADLLLFVSDALSGLTESELSFLRRGYGYCNSVIFPLTKKDLTPDYETFVEDNRSKISSTLDIPVDEVTVIPVSSSAKLRYLQRGSKAAYISSNFAQLEEAFWAAIAKRRGEVLLRPYLAAARAELAKLLDNLVAQYQTLGSNMAESLMNELKEMMLKLELLQDQGAEWRSDLNLFFTLLQTDMTNEQQKITQEAQDLVEERIRKLDKKICKPENYNALVSDVNDIITRGLLDIRDTIADRTEMKVQTVRDSLDLDVNVNESALGKLQFQPTEVEINFPKKKATERLINGGRSIKMNAMGGSAAGGILGGIIGFCVGGPVGMAYGAAIGTSGGSLLGGAKGCVEALAKYDQLDVNTVNRAINKHINNSMRVVASSVNSAIAEIRATVTSTFEKELKKRVKELNENIAQLKKNLSLAEHELAKRKEELKAQIGQLNQAVKYLDTLDQKIAGASFARVSGAGRRADPVKQIPAQERSAEPAAVETSHYAFL